MTNAVAASKACCSEKADENMSETRSTVVLSDQKRSRLKAIDQLAFGLIITLWGGLLTLKQVGIIGKDISTLPFVFVAFGALLIFGGVYKLVTRE